VEAERPLQPSVDGRAAALSVGCLCVRTLVALVPRPHLRDLRHATYPATQPNLVVLVALLLPLVAEAKIPGGRVHGWGRRRDHYVHPGDVVVVRVAIMPVTRVQGVEQV
jgi:hypothetical protein